MSPEDMRRAREWGYDIWAVPYESLAALAYNVLVSQPEMEALTKLDRTRLWHFVTEVSRRYHKRPFHNLRHAVDVLLAATSLLRMVQQSSAVLAQSDSSMVMALLTAAFVHDIDHPGCMNSYLVATNHPLAVRYSGRSVLENHHSETAFTLLARAELDFLCHVTKQEKAEFIEAIRTTVLATDAGTTVTKLGEFERLVQQRQTPSREMLMCMLIKAADVSNPTRPPLVYQQWIDGVMEEFLEQGDAEKQLGLPVSTNCDRDTVNVARTQTGFVSFLVSPLFHTLHSYAPALKPVIDQLDANHSHYANQAEKA